MRVLLLQTPNYQTLRYIIGIAFFSMTLIVETLDTITISTITTLALPSAGCVVNLVNLVQQRRHSKYVYFPTNPPSPPQPPFFFYLVLTAPLRHLAGPPAWQFFCEVAACTPDTRRNIMLGFSTSRAIGGTNKT